MVEVNGRLQPFLRDKLFASIYDSLRHRKTALNDATALTDTVIAKVLGLISDGRIEGTVITQQTSAILKRFDQAAAVHYAAYHPLTP